MEECPSCPRSFDSERGRDVHHALEHGESLRTKETSCNTEGCNTVFEYYPSDKEGLYCGDCTSSKTEPLKKECDNCGKNITVRKRGVEFDSNYCSEKCMGEGAKGEKYVVNCEECGSTFKIPPWRKTHNRTQTYFCDQQCFKKYKSSQTSDLNTSNYGSGWIACRREVRKRDNFCCQLCGKGVDNLGKVPDAHHITPVRWFIEMDGWEKSDAHYIENLILLCGEHHSKVELGSLRLEEELTESKLSELELSDPQP